MSDSDNEKLDKVKEYIHDHERNTVIWQVSEIKTEIDTLKTEVNGLIWSENPENWLLWNLIDILGSNKHLLEYAKLSLKDKLTLDENFKFLKYEILLSLRCNYFAEFKRFLKNLKEWGDVSRDAENFREITPDNWIWNWWDEREWDRWHQKEWTNGNNFWKISADSQRRWIQWTIFEKWQNKKKIPQENVRYAWNYIKNGGKFYSPTLWNITWWSNKYKHVCSTWSYNVLRKLWLPKVSKSLNVDLEWKILPKMWLEYIWDVDPDNPERNWYKPQDWDTAVWPRFNNNGRMTQHQATYINWHWVSDTIQRQMSCYSSKNEPKNVKIYRYTWNIQIA